MYCLLPGNSVSLSSPSCWSFRHCAVYILGVTRARTGRRALRSQNLQHALPRVCLLGNFVNCDISLCLIPYSPLETRFFDYVDERDESSKKWYYASSFLENYCMSRQRAFLLQLSFFSENLTIVENTYITILPQSFWRLIIRKCIVFYYL